MPKWNANPSSQWWLPADDEDKPKKKKIKEENIMDAIAIQGYNQERTIINGSNIERIYLSGDSIAFSEIVYAGKDREDAVENFYMYYKPTKTWYMSGNELKCM